ncbi:MAG TPA: hypothetical protein VH061_09300 [Solirubrobacteraceae bacterium]|jgi:hypothetical protein|nr:hypothetical protein [Solirubrobacteraceae bacterium]
MADGDVTFMLPRREAEVIEWAARYAVAHRDRIAKSAVMFTGHSGPPQNELEAAQAAFASALDAA